MRRCGRSGAPSEVSREGKAPPSERGRGKHSPTANPKGSLREHRSEWSTMFSQKTQFQSQGIRVTVEPHAQARRTSTFFGGTRQSIPSYAQGFGGLPCLAFIHGQARAFLRRRVTCALFQNRRAEITESFLERLAQGSRTSTSFF
jgi:hypothetical protein